MLDNIPKATKTLLIINIVIFFITFVARQSGIELSTIFGSFYPESVNFKIWQPLTHIFMHADIWHIFFNMFALYMFGSIIERAVGLKRFLALYFIAGFGAFFLFNVQSFITITNLKNELQATMPLSYYQEILNFAFNNPIEINGSYRLIQLNDDVSRLFTLYATPMVGASGAIYGLLAVFGFLYPNEKLIFPLIPVPVAAKIFIPALLIIEFGSGIFSGDRSNIAHFAHIGGAIAGILVLLYWRYSYKNRRR